MTENQNYKTNFSGSSLYQIPTKCVNCNMDTSETHLYPYVSELDCIIDQYDRESEFM
jgi:hypothetical protein